MSNQSTHHDQSLPNSIPQNHNQPIAPIKPENDSTDDDVVFVESVRKVHNTLEDYDPECQCRMCQLVKKFYAEHTHACNCPCEECRERQTNQVNQEQAVESSENVPIANAVSLTNGQPSSSSTNQNNDAPTSEHTNANDLVDDDRESRSSTPDYMPRFFDDEIGDSDSESSVDSGVDQDDMELDQESDNDDNDDDGNKNDPEYANAVSPTNGQPSSSSIIQNNDASTSEHTNANDERETTSQCSRCRRKVQFLMAHLRHHKYSGFRCTWPNCGFFYTKLSKAKKHICVDHLQVNASANSPQVRHYLIRVGPKLDKKPRRRSPNSTSSTSENDLLSSDTKEQATDNDESLKLQSNTEQTSFGPPKCEASFGETSRLVRNHRLLYQEWKPFYCKWPKCDFVADTRDTVADHANSKHFKLLNKSRARKYVGMHG